MRRTSLVLLLVLLAPPVMALEADEQFDSPVMESRARALYQQIRCVVCQAESIDESPALLAGDMRRFVRQGMSDGKDDAAILASLQQRYGDAVLMAPPLRAHTLLLWLAPGLLLLVGGFIAWRVMRKA